MHCILLYCVLFNQKTAYEMRISDWSSDVCSSDLFLEVIRRVLREVVIAGVVVVVARHFELATRHFKALADRCRAAELRRAHDAIAGEVAVAVGDAIRQQGAADRKSTRLNSSH